MALIERNKNLQEELKLRSIHPILQEENFMSKLIKAASESNPKKKYDEELKSIALYLFLLGGRLLYEHLVKNLPLPSLSTVLKYLNDEEPLVEGGFCFTELKDFLNNSGYSHKVWLSEDATKVQATLKYFSKNDTIVGLTLPLNENGVPKKDFYKFTSIKHVEEFVAAHDTSEYGNIVYLF